jgi:hypothetical protein
VPPLSRWYIKAALIYLVAGLLVGALGALQQPLHLPQLFALAGLGFAINTWPRVKVR